MDFIDIVGFIIKMKSDKETDENILTEAKTKGIDPSVVQAGFKAIDDDVVLTIRTLTFFTPVNPIEYRIGIRRTIVIKNILWGLLKNTDEVGIKTIDKAHVQQKIIGASVIILHADQSEVRIEYISKKDAADIERLLGYIIEAQRRNVVNLTSD